MRQLPLDIAGEAPQTFGTFFTGRNEELVSLLLSIANRSANRDEQRFVYLWGDRGCGKSHLLNALEDRCGDGEVLRLGPQTAPEGFRYSQSVWSYLLDDCDRLDPQQQVAAFSLFNQIREQGGALVAAGACAPASLAVREDLRTRLGWGLVYQVHGLTDDEKLTALERSARVRGLELSPGLLPWLITHCRRDMPSLSALLDALDRYSLETRRPATLPLLKELLELDEMKNN